MPADQRPHPFGQGRIRALPPKKIGNNYAAPLLVMVEEHRVEKTVPGRGLVVAEGPLQVVGESRDLQRLVRPGVQFQEPVQGAAQVAQVEAACIVGKRFGHEPVDQRQPAAGVHRTAASHSCRERTVLSPAWRAAMPSAAAAAARTVVR